MKTLIVRVLVVILVVPCWIYEFIPRLLNALAEATQVVFVRAVNQWNFVNRP
jgi:hypothetical protein